MAKPRDARWHVVAVFVPFVVLGACTCGGRAECASRGQISLLTAVHDDASCNELSPRGVLLYEAARYLVETRNNRTNDDGLELELDVVDTCGGITGALKAAMKALVRADVNCLQPPHYLGIIGPDGTTHVEVVQRITSVLKVPQIVGEASRGPYSHHLSKDDGSHVVQGILKVLEALRWKSFVLATNGESDIAKTLTAKAIARSLCVVLDERGSGFTSHIVHVGKPAASFFADPVNATILVVSEGSSKNYLNRVISANTILLLENARNDLDELKERVERSRLRMGENRGVAVKYDPEGLITELGWLEGAIDVYAKALNAMCRKRKQCTNHIASPVEWNNEMTRITAAREVASRSATRTLDLFAKDKVADSLKVVGRVTVSKNDAKIRWRRDDKKAGDDDDDDDDDDFVPETVRKIRSRRKEPHRSGCATSTDDVGVTRNKEEDDDDDEVARIIVSEMNDREWWTTVATVSGVGVAMFAVGILAVYVIYSNIRGPRNRKGNSSGMTGSFDRDASLRRIDNERKTSIAVERDQRRDRKVVQRRDSNRSIGSNASDRTV